MHPLDLLAVIIFFAILFLFYCFISFCRAQRTKNSGPSEPDRTNETRGPRPLR
jgi:hypothetical protein